MNKKIIILVLLLITLSGCTKKINIEDPETKETKSYVSNIVCKPEEDGELSKVYEENKDKLEVDYDKLPDCSDLKINSGGYEGLWTSIFVKPLAWIIVELGNLVKNLGISIMILGVILRALLLPLSRKQANMSENMKKAQKDLNRLETKYKGKEDRESMMAKSQEMLLIYKKYDISPFAGCLFSFLQLPLFFAFLEAIYRVPAIMEETLWKFHLGTTPIEGFQAGNYWYIILVVLIIAATYFSFRNMSVGDDAQAKQMKMMSTFMVVFISIVSFSLPAGIALYWIVSNAFTIIQNLIMKKGKL